MTKFKEAGWTDSGARFAAAAMINREICNANNRRDGRMEGMDEQIEALTSMLGKLVEKLLDERALTPEQVVEIVGYGWEISDNKVDNASTGV